MAMLVMVASCENYQGRAIYATDLPVIKLHLIQAILFNFNNHHTFFRA